MRYLLECAGQVNVYASYLMPNLNRKHQKVETETKICKIVNFARFTAKKAHIKKNKRTHIQNFKSN